MKNIVDFSKVEKELLKLPKHIQRTFSAWCVLVQEQGILETRKIRGFNDEALKGKASKFRSVRLNRAYRVIYFEEKENIIIRVIEVNKHDYKKVYR